MGKNMLDYIAMGLVFVGALNWGLVGMFDWNLVGYIFGSWFVVERIVYTVVGLSGVYGMVRYFSE